MLNGFITSLHVPQKVISTISFLIAGFASLAFQIVSFKLITFSGLSDALSVAISLTGFVSLSGLGALLAARVRRQTTAGLLEFLMGLYGLVVFGALFALGIEQVLGLLAGNTLGEKLVLFMLATGPLAFLAGMLIPLHQYRRGQFSIDPRRSDVPYEDKSDFSNFAAVYFVFHAGGALSLLLVEIIAFPLMGWPLVGTLLAGLSALNGLYVISAAHVQPTEPHTNQSQKIKLHRLLPWLFLLSVLTGFAGLVSYKMFDFLVTTNIQNYAVVTSLIFLAFTLTTIIAHKIRLSFRGILSASGVGILCFFLPIALVPMLALPILETGFSHWWVYGLAGGLLIIPAYTLIGLSVPSAVRLGVPSHQALFVVALGNALGYWLYILTAHYNVDAVILIAGVALLLLAGRPSAWLVAMPLTAILAFTISPHFMPATHHMVAAHRFISAEQKSLSMMNDKQKNSHNQRWVFDVVKAWNTYGWPIEHVKLERFTNGVLDYYDIRYLANGYESLTIRLPESFQMGESFMAGLPMLYAPDGMKH